MFAGKSLDPKVSARHVTSCGFNIHWRCVKVRPQRALAAVEGLGAEEDALVDRAVGEDVYSAI